MEQREAECCFRYVVILSEAPHLISVLLSRPPFLEGFYCVASLPGSIFFLVFSPLLLMVTSRIVDNLMIPFMITPDLPPHSLTLLL